MYFKEHPDRYGPWIPEQFRKVDKKAKTPLKEFLFEYRDGEFVLIIYAKSEKEAWEKVSYGTIDKIEMPSAPHLDMLKLMR